jgi:hypothetical protein
VEECVSISFLVVGDLSLLSTKHVALHTSYNIEIRPHKHTIPIATKSSKTNNIGGVGSSFYPSLKVQWVKIMASFARYGFSDDCLQVQPRFSDLESNGPSKIYWRDLICFTITRIYIVMVHVS